MRRSLRRKSVARSVGLFAPGILIVGWAVCKDAGDVAAAPPEERAIQAAIDRGMGFLRTSAANQSGGRATIACLALIKGGEPVDSPLVKRLLDLIVAKVRDGVYTPANLHEHVYEAGLDAITLEAADPDKYRDQIAAVARYLIRVQNPNGDWYYAHQQNTGGDTSITQYGVLGLWAAARAGFDVPGEAWDKAAAWHVGTQGADGGFTYHPGAGTVNPQIGVTTAGSASLHVCRMYLYPNADRRGLRRPEEPKKAGPSATSTKKFGVLERVEIAPPPKPAKPGEPEPKAKGPPPRYVAKTSLDRIDESINKGIAWITDHFTIENPPTFKHYYLYGLERLSALADVTVYGEHDWYEEGSAHLLATQAQDGSWNSNAGPIADTAFSLLFLVRATNKMLNRQEPVRRIGAGLLAGGRGLPDNLAGVNLNEGKVGSRKVQGAIDELLAELENTKSNPLESVQAAIVEQIQVGDRETLIGQVDRLKKLAGDPRPEVRRTALWALGRSRDLRVAPLLLAALEDSDVDVVVEAHNGLCYLSRKPHGVGVPSNPLKGLDEDATVEQRTAALRKWQAQATREWKAWHFSVRPYDDRHDLAEPRPSK